MTSGGDVSALNMSDSDSREVDRWRTLRGGAYKQFLSPITAELANDARSVRLYDQRDGSVLSVRDWQADMYLSKPMIEKYETVTGGRVALMSRAVPDKFLYARTPPALANIVPFRPVGGDVKAVTESQPERRKRRRGSRGSR